jgi:hypothetical protein
LWLLIYELFGGGELVADVGSVDPEDYVGRDVGGVIFDAVRGNLFSLFMRGSLRPSIS